MVDNVRDTVCSFDNLYKAMRKCKKGVTWKDSVSRYANNGLASTLRLQNNLVSGSYKLSDYYKFTIHEPKKREIVSTNFKDRVFQRSLCDNYLYDEVTKTFIYDNGACQIDRGTDFSRRRLKTHLQRYFREYGNEGYVLKIDMKNYFGSTPHATAKKSLEKVVDDEWALSHTHTVIDSYNTDGKAVGLGLGSQTTQLVQLLVLNDIDHLVKEKLGVEHYVRYMDDMVLIHPKKEYLELCLAEIENNITGLGLSLNKRKTQTFKISQGIRFLGFKFSLSTTGAVFIVITKENIKKRKRKLRQHKNLVDRGLMTKAKADECYRSWKAHANNGHSYNLIQNMDKYYESLWETKKCSNA